MIYIPLIILVILMLLFIVFESSGYNIVEYEVKTGKDIMPVRIVMLSDLHDTDVTHDNNRRLMESIDSAKPDLVILAGDMITCYPKPSADHDKTFAFLKDLASRYKVYYALGNHEQRYKEEAYKYPGKFEEIVKNIKESGMELISDSFTDIDDNNIRIYGFDIPLDNYKRAVRSKLPEGILINTFGECIKERFSILIAHTPDHFEEYAEWHPDLVLSGHLHGGIVGIPGIGGVLSPQLKLFPKYDFGKYEKDKTTLIVSRGIGWHSVPIRIFNKAEIVVIDIQQDRGEKNGNQC